MWMNLGENDLMQGVAGQEMFFSFILEEIHPQLVWPHLHVSEAHTESHLRKWAAMKAAFVSDWMAHVRTDHAQVYPCIGKCSF